MRPWTTRTLQAAVVAAGLAAAGTGTASAAQIPELTEPDLSTIPDEIGFNAPIDACRAQDAPGFNETKAPCLDARLRVSAPNVVKQVGVQVVRTTHDVSGVLGDGRSLDTAKLTHVSQHIGEAKNSLVGLTKTRPTIGVSAQPQHTGLLEPHSPQSSLLDAEIGPRGETHEGVSGVDTALALTAAQGYRVGPVVNTGAALQPIVRADEHTGRPRLDLPEPSQIAPGAKQVTSMTHADELSNVPEQTVDQVADGVGPGVGQVGRGTVRAAGDLGHRAGQGVQHGLGTLGLHR